MRYELLQWRAFLADRAAARSMIGYWHDTVVRPSVRPSVYSVCDAVYIVALSVGVGELENCTVVFLGGHFLFTSSDTFAVGCIV